MEPVRTFGDAASVLEAAGVGRSVLYRRGHQFFAQGDAGDCLFYIQQGTVRLGVVSAEGKEATIALLGPEDFVGQECVAAGRCNRLATATATSDCLLLRIERTEMVRVLAEDQMVSERFVAYLLERHARTQADLVDQMFHTTEKRLARALVMLAQVGKEGAPETITPKVSQEALAAMVGTSRSRVNFFMNRFRKLGLIEYDGRIHVNRSLVDLVLHD